MKETDLYQPVKDFFEAEGYEVKAEINGCDVVASKDDAPTVIIELKVSFSLDLVLQGIDRQKLSDDVYLAVPKPDTPIKRKNWRKRQRALVHLCRRLGVGLLLIDIEATSPLGVNVLLDPAPYQPRKNAGKQTRLQKEFVERVGDPNTGGITKTKIITAYRQDAIRCAEALSEGSTLKVAEIKITTGVTRAASILQKNHYGWFERVTRGVYQLTEHGEAALRYYKESQDASG